MDSPSEQTAGADGPASRDHRTGDHRTGDHRTERNSHKGRLRHRARELALQALYQWHMAGASVGHIEAEFRDHNDMSRVDAVFFHELLTGVTRQVGRIDSTLTELLDHDRNSDKLDPIAQAALRLGCFEMMERPDIPYKVIINEGVELARKFGPKGSYKILNGMLDTLAKKLRTGHPEHRRAEHTEHKVAPDSPVTSEP